MAARASSLVVGAGESGLPMDRLLLRHLPGMTRAKVRLLLEADRLRVNGKPPARPGVPVQTGDRIAIASLPASEPDDLAVLFQDPAFRVLLKPSGLPLPQRIALAGREAGARQRPGRPWRVLLPLDRRLSGVTLAAGHLRASRQLASQLESGRAGRRFLALVQGSAGRASGPLGASGWSYKRLRRFRDADLLRLVPPPDAGADPLRALATAGLAPLPLDGGPGRLAVHACGLFFLHPRSGRALHFDPPPPAPFQARMVALDPVPTLAADLPPAPPHGPASEPDLSGGAQRALRSPRALLQRAGRGGRRG